MRRIHAAEIDLQPDFQRGEVWNEDRQRRLIDTVLRGWYVPAIHLLNDPDTSRDLVLDGQQRLSAIRDFFDDGLKVDGSLSPFDPTLSSWDGLRYSQLPDEAQRRVRRFPLTVVTLHNYEPQEPYELFFRLNQHMSLTPPEKRNALYGVARDQVKAVVERLIESGLLVREVVGFANSRLAYDDVFARVALALEVGSLRESHSNRAIEEFYRTGEFSPRTISDVSHAAEEFLTHARDVGPKLNKATLFSWLVFTHAAQRMDVPVDSAFVGYFEEARRAAKTALSEIRPDLRSVFRTYNDRASYRVNDTLSILLRDLALHVAYAAANPKRDQRNLSGVLGALRQSDGEDDRALIEFLESSDWDLAR
ncbi:hypothetical protein DSM104299_02519 [Baekduia alba]|nr:hypothetical protein DSM104299_02519 [Baekduia alba]